MESQNCLASENGSTCSTCKDKYHNNNGVCEQVDIPNCLVYTGDKCSNCGDKHLYECECYDVIDRCTAQAGTDCASCGELHLYEDRCYTKIANCVEQAGNICNSCGALHLYNNECYTIIAHCTNQTGSTCSECETGYSGATCTSCTPGYKAQGSECVEKYPGGIYVSGLNKVVWVTRQTMNWSNASTYCQNNRTEMIMPSLADLKTIYNYKTQLGISSGDYWSSTIDTNVGYGLRFINALQLDGSSTSFIRYVLCTGNP